MKKIVKTWEGKEIEIEIKDHFTYGERNAILDKSTIATNTGSQIMLGTLANEVLKTAIVKVPEGIDWEKDIRTEDLDEIFSYYMEELGLKKTEKGEAGK